MWIAAAQTRHLCGEDERAGDILSARLYLDCGPLQTLIRARAEQLKRLSELVKPFLDTVHWLSAK